MNDDNNRMFHKLQKRISYFTAFLMALCVLIGGRILWLQVVQGSSLGRLADAQTEEDRKLQSPRGTILDCNGKVLAISEIAKSLYGDPKMINRSPEEMAAILAPYVKTKPEVLVDRLQRDTAFTWLDRAMDHEKYDALCQVIKDQKLEGLGFIDESHRHYPNGRLAAQLIGFVGSEDKGLDGVEMILDKEIKGDIRKLRLTTDRNNIPIFQSTLEQILPDKERSVTLTIDSTIQYITETALDGIVSRSHPTGVAAIIMDPKTGDILAMASRPTFDPNQFGKGNTEAYKNRAVVNLYEPGSTFKPIIASAALDAGTWHIDDVFNDIGYVNVGDRQIRNWDDSGYGRVTLTDILKFSINTGMANIGLHTGGAILTDYAKRYGFGKATGIELPGEGDGILFNPDDMSLVDVATMSIGQGVAVTPLQMVQAFGAIANGGHMMKPHVIKDVINPDGSVYSHTEPKEVGTPVEPDVTQTIRTIMEQEISSGGGQNAKVEGYRFCGKTGTAQRLNARGTGYAEGQYIGSFVGFGPYEDPQFVVLIVVDNPSGVYYGAQVAAPVFKEIMTQVVRARGIRPSVSHQKERKTVPVSERAKKDLPSIQRTADGVILPDFSGWNSRDVNDWLAQAGLSFVPNGTGIAVYQHPRAGSVVGDDDAIHVTFMR